MNACVLPKERQNVCLGMGAWSWGIKIELLDLAGIAIERRGSYKKISLFHHFMIKMYQQSK